MAGSFVRPSLTIRLSVDYFSFDLRYLERPSNFDEPIFRVLIHELTHFWQTLSMNFLTKVAISEWNRLIEFESEGSRSLPPLSGVVKKLRERDPQSGLTPNDLLESLALYWEIAILGAANVKNWRRLNRQVVNVGTRQLRRSIDSPVKSQSSTLFDEVMLSDSLYSAPYKTLHDATDSFYTALVFPIAVYFAFQSDDPVKVYMESIRTIRPLVKGIHGTPDIDKQREVYFDAIADHVRKAANNVDANFEAPRSAFLSLASEVENSKDNPLFVHYAHQLAELEAQARKIAGADLNRYFALLGVVEYRRELMGGGPMPPLVQFGKGGKWALQGLIHQYWQKGDYDETQPDELADIAKNVLDRWSIYRIATLPL